MYYPLPESLTFRNAGLSKSKKRKYNFKHEGTIGNVYQPKKGLWVAHYCCKRAFGATRKEAVAMVLRKCFHIKPL